MARIQMTSGGTRSLGMHIGLRMALAVLSGSAMAAAFPPFGASLLAPLAVAGMTLSVWGVRARRGALLGGVAGAVFFLILLRWVAIVGSDAWLALSLFCAAWFALLGAATVVLTRIPGWPVWIACAWVLQEALRDRIPLGGFPWGRLAFAQTATTLTPWASIGGAALVTFATALAGTALAAVVLMWRDSTRLRTGLVVAGIVVVGVSGLALPRAESGETAGGPPETVAAVIQGGVPTTGLGAGDERREVLRRHAVTTVKLADAVRRGEEPQPDLVVWPENSTDIDPLADAAAAAEISAAAGAIGVPILVGAVLIVDDRSAANVGIVWDPRTGPGEMYVKQRPVPFGEYVPWRDVLTRIIGRFDRVPRDFIAGTTSGVLTVGDARIGDVICFEVAYDDVVRNAVVDGGRALVVQTNNATFAGLGQPEQQVAMSRLRAVETGRTVLVAATSGISAVIAPTGALAAEIGEGGSGWMVQTVPLRDSLTPAMRLGAIPEILLAGIAVIGLVWSGLRRSGLVRTPARWWRPRDDIGSQA